MTIDEKFVLELNGRIQDDQIRDYFKKYDEILNQNSLNSTALLKRMHTLHFYPTKLKNIQFLPQHIQTYLIDTMKEYDFEYFGGASFYQKRFSTNNYRNLKECIYELMSKGIEMALSWQDNAY
ncbi:hypothetical protein [Helicobacter pylori]|uniref:hypothetical protein n=1 Tax=Helicobacter pylori TaxID=210 RepID=UPI000EAEF3A7|nr:hypothetical protein [Helicobacter pylori]